MKTRAITLMKEDVLSLGRMVSSMTAELSRMLTRDPSSQFTVIEQQEDQINARCQKIEERCLDMLNEYQDLTAQDIRTLVGSTLIAAKFERLADHAHRVAKMVWWTSDSEVALPPEFSEMANLVHSMVDETLICYLTDKIERLPEIVQRDSHVNYLHDVASKKLMSDLGVQGQEEAQTSTQLLFCVRYLERMGDCVASIARRTHFIVTGDRLNAEV